MDKGLLDDLRDGDPVAVALRGGAGWVRGMLVWKREDVMLIKAEESALKSSPYVLVLMAHVAALGVPREVAPLTPEPRQAGFMR